MKCHLWGLYVYHLVICLDRIRSRGTDGIALAMPSSSLKLPVSEGAGSLFFLFGSVSKKWLAMFAAIPFIPLFPWTSRAKLVSSCPSSPPHTFQECKCNTWKKFKTPTTRRESLNCQHLPTTSPPFETFSPQQAADQDREAKETWKGRRDSPMGFSS